MGFLPVVKEILDQAHLGGQRLLFSATLDRGVDSLVRQYLKNPKTHSLQNDRASVSTMEHHVLQMHPGDKDDITSQIAARNGKTILFVKTQRGADRLADKLANAGVPVGALHGGKSQAVRTAHLHSLKNKKIQHLSQLMLQLVEFTLMESHSLFTSTFHKIIRIIYTVQVAQLALANQEQSLPCHHQRIHALYQDFSHAQE